METVREQCPIAPWCTEGDHRLTYHKAMLAQHQAVSVTPPNHGVTVQVEMWALFDWPTQVRVALTLVNASAGLPQIDAELTRHQAVDVAVALELGAGRIGR